MNLLVTGGAGFIGSNFIRYILDNSDYISIINVDDLKYGSNQSNLSQFNNDSRYAFVKGNISNSTMVSKLIGNADAVINFAAETHVDRSISTPKAFLQSNVIGVFNILEALRKENPSTRMIQISTDEVYGDIMKGSFKESDALCPSSPYSASKAASDVFVLGYARTYDLNASITRCTNNYGPGQFPEKLIPKTIIRASLGLKIPIYGTGENIRDWIHVEDHCRAVEKVLKLGKPGRIYNISSGEERNNLEIIKTILEIMGKGEGLLEFVEDRPGHDFRYSLDSSRIRREMGWNPSFSFEQGIKETVRWYEDNKDWWNALADEKTLSCAPWKLAW